ncbi:MAG TPA: hypothetical protein DCS17_09515, partial [Flavobacterium sp.]|nr:hypothetical protein [Flavobacterium sp.]
DSNSQQDSWKNWISNIEQNHKELFQWLLNQFDIKTIEWYKKKELLEEAINNPGKLLGVLSELQLRIEQFEQGLKPSLDQLEKDNYTLFKWLLDVFEINNFTLQKNDTLANNMKDAQKLFAVFKKIQESDLSLKTEIDQLQKTKPQLFNSLLQCFEISPNYWASENLEKKMRDHKVLFGVFAKLSQYSGANYQQQQNCQQKIEDLAKNNQFLFNYLLKSFIISENLPPNQQKQQLEIKLLDPILSVQAFSNFYDHCKRLNTQLQDTKDSENAMRQELEKLQKEKRSVSYYEDKMQELEAENEALKKKSGEMFATLSRQNRNETTTITSDNSRRQRDTLISEFQTLASQDFKRITVQIFNYLILINPELQNNRKQEEAKIRSILSERILIAGFNWITEKNSVSSESNLWITKAKEITQLITQDLFQQSTGNISKEIIESLENLTQKGLKLVKDIINDQPPGELWIEPKGKNFNPDKHEPIIGCEADGLILYTTYPGYRTGSRILEKAIVFTVPKSETNPPTNDVEITSNIGETNTESSDISLSSKLISAADKVKGLNEKGMSDQNIASKIVVSSQTVSNWKKGESHPSKDNAEKLDQLYQEFCGKSSNLENNSSTNEEQKIFSGVVSRQYGTQLYNSPKQSDICHGNFKNLHDLVSFDKWTEGEKVTVFENQTPNSDNIWLKVADTDYWIPRAHIRLDQELS